MRQVDAVLFQVQLLCPWCNELRTKAQNAEGALRALCERVLGGAQPRDRVTRGTQDVAPSMPARI